MTELEIFDKLLSLGVSVAEIVTDRTGLTVNLVGVSPLYRSEFEWNMVFCYDKNEALEEPADFHIVIFPSRTHDNTDLEVYTQDELENSLMEGINLRRTQTGKSIFI